ncbi:FAD-dependent oxidoreductase [Candidatus Saccharibacteria bacterium]|nr:FAD-dependent oxidoreductase [Candidatus Saccharibacteria bacterium]
MQELEGVYSFVFQPDEKIIWTPGQYMHYTLEHPQTDTRGNERWFTISTAPYEKNIMITTRMAAKGGSSFKDALLNLQIGDEIDSNGPKGQFIIKEGDYNHILIAGGIGVTPYRSMMLQLNRDGKNLPIDLFYANRNEELVFSKVFSELESDLSNFTLKRFVGDNRIEKSDFVPYLGKTNSLFYISGPKAMVETYQRLLESLKVAEEQILTDYFPGYGA